MRGRGFMMSLVAFVAAVLCGTLALSGTAARGATSGTAGTAASAGTAVSAGTASAGPVRGGWLAARSTGDDFGTLACAPGRAGHCTTAGAGLNALPVVSVSAAGTWGPAKAIPGVATLIAGSDADFASVDTISCPSAGDCLAAGSYSAKSGLFQGYVAEETRGTWHKAVPVPGLARLNTGGGVFILGGSCASPGNCAITGSYTPGKPGSLADEAQAFVASETGGVWQQAITVPGTAALNAGDYAEGRAISCAAPGWCALGGDYQATSGGYDQPFVASESNGKWGTAGAVPGIAALFPRGDRQLAAVSCPAPGDCVAAGNTFAGGFALRLSGGAWSTAVTIAGLGELDALSCPAAGACVAAGSTSFGYGGFAATAAQSAGVWGKAVMLPGAKAYTHKGKKATSSGISDLSCPAVGYCVAGGQYAVSVSDSTAYFAGLLAGETAGVWGTAGLVPGLARLDTGAEGGVSNVACAAIATCVALGSYAPAGQGSGGGFRSAELPRQPTRTALRLTHATAVPGKEQAVMIAVSVIARGTTPGAVPVGKVVVRAGSATLCVIRLAAGAGKAKGSCALRPSQLRKGTYHVVAGYPGSSPFAGSASPATVLRVT